MSALMSARCSACGSLQHRMALLDGKCDRCVADRPTPTPGDSTP